MRIELPNNVVLMQVLAIFCALNLAMRPTWPAAFAFAFTIAAIIAIRALEQIDEKRFKDFETKLNELDQRIKTLAVGNAMGGRR